jgi:hypothetical protein
MLSLAFSRLHNIIAFSQMTLKTGVKNDKFLTVDHAKKILNLKLKLHPFCLENQWCISVIDNESWRKAL